MSSTAAIAGDTTSGRRAIPSSTRRNDMMNLLWLADGVA
jgi:hypothetical protein